MEGIDFDNIRTLIDRIYRMRPVMPVLNYKIVNNEEKGQYKITVAGMDYISYSFINYLIEILGNTFLENYEIGIFKTPILPNIPSGKRFYADFHLRKTKAPIRISYIRTLNDRSNMANIVGDFNPSVKRMRPIFETDDESGRKEIKTA